MLLPLLLLLLLLLLPLLLLLLLLLLRLLPPPAVLLLLLQCCLAWSARPAGCRGARGLVRGAQRILKGGCPAGVGWVVGKVLG